MNAESEFQNNTGKDIKYGEPVSEQPKNPVFEIDHDNPKKVLVSCDGNKYRVFPLFFKEGFIFCVAHGQDRLYLENEDFDVEKWESWELIPEPKKRDITIDELIDRKADFVVSKNGNRDRITAFLPDDNKLVVRNIQYEIFELFDCNWVTADEPRKLNSFEVDE